MELMKASSSLYWETVVMLTLEEVSLTCMWAEVESNELHLLALL